MTSCFTWNAHKYFNLICTSSLLVLVTNSFNDPLVYLRKSSAWAWSRWLSSAGTGSCPLTSEL